MHRLVAAIFVVLPLVLAAAVAAASDTEAESSAPVAPAAVSTREAKKLVAAFDRDVKAARKLDVAAHRREAELTAVRVLLAGAHERVARRLADAAADEALLPTSRSFAVASIPLQGEHGRAQSARVAAWLRRAAEVAARDLRSGRIGVPIDPRSGEPITHTPEAQQALRDGEARAGLLVAGLTTLRGLEHTPKGAADLLRPFLQSPFNELAVAAIETAQAWEERDVARDLALLLRMYPAENRWETGAVAHISGTNASAKAAWMALFGHPLKQRPRPAVHRAVVACLTGWAGRPISDPAACDAWLSSASKRRR